MIDADEAIVELLTQVAEIVEVPVDGRYRYAGLPGEIGQGEVEALLLEQVSHRVQNAVTGPLSI